MIAGRACLKDYLHLHLSKLPKVLAKFSSIITIKVKLKAISTSQVSYFIVIITIWLPNYSLIVNTVHINSSVQVFAWSIHYLQFFLHQPFLFEDGILPASQCSILKTSCNHLTNY